MFALLSAFEVVGFCERAFGHYRVLSQEIPEEVKGAIICIAISFYTWLWSGYSDL